ncbi:MAG: hypothetical protein AVDCRST_MAG56-929 [uncultured Cytophagales bacterium]|uniref:Uncharacterized protein n=1 Tax=uncultured Cytophagales bacterium TaxID=158755 RepID=A0A6J4HQN7_9SPHI|nr:MAG: hypothetical protein AVDCRST_MAG56-929 [uncultured Cytophagales bacterium]
MPLPFRYPPKNRANEEKLITNPLINQAPVSSQADVWRSFENFCRAGSRRKTLLQSNPNHSPSSPTYLILKP